MTIQIQLDDSEALALRQKALALGQELSVYVSAVLRREAQRPLRTLREIAADIEKRRAEPLNMSEEEIEFVLEVISELHLKLPSRAGITAEDTEDLALVVRSFEKVLHPVPVIYIHPIDPDDSPYVNLALAADAELIVSRDKHLLGLNDPALRRSNEFRDRFSGLRVLTPVQYLVERQEQPEA